MANILPVIKTGLENVAFILKEFAKFIDVLFRYKKLQLLILIILLGTAFYLGLLYWGLNNRYQKIVYNTLYTKSEATPQKYKGMEAFILSYLEQDLDKKLEKSKLHSKFIETFKKMQDAVTKYDSSKWKVDLEVVSKKNVQILTDNNDQGFLFVPIYILRKSFSSSDLQTLRNGSKADQDSILNTVKSEREIFNDIRFTKSLSESLVEFSECQVVDGNVQSLEDIPSQVYLITKNGINRIFSKDHINDARLYYGKQFPSTTFFPSRPYFWPVFADRRYYITDKTELVPDPTKRLGETMFISKPYMDLAGNGFVITVAKGVEFNGIKAVICFDLALIRSGQQGTKTTIDYILDKISKDIDLDDRQTVIGKVLENGRLEIDNKSNLASDFRNFVSQLDGNDLANVVGNIQVFNKENSDYLEVSIPVGNISNDNRVEFTLFKIDLAKLRSKAFKVAIAAFIAFATMIFFLSYLYGSTIRRFEEYEEAFNKVDEVMYKSPIPYCRLSAKDEIKDANPAFCEMLGYNPLNKDEIKLLQQKKFMSLCANAESIKKYEEVEEKRKQHQEVNPYELTFKTKSGKNLTLIVISGQFPFSLKGRLPETFGILLDPKNDYHRKYYEEFDTYSFQVN